MRREQARRGLLVIPIKSFTGYGTSDPDWEEEQSDHIRQIGKIVNTGWTYAEVKIKNSTFAWPFRCLKIYEGEQLDSVPLAGVELELHQTLEVLWNKDFEKPQAIEWPKPWRELEKKNAIHPEGVSERAKS